MANKLLINSNLDNQIREALLKEGLYLSDINVILNGDYQNFASEDEIKSKLPSIFKDDEYANIIQALADGYTLNEMSQELGINLAKINTFKDILKNNNLSVEEIKAFNKYTVGSNMILGFKRGIPKEQILASIINDFNLRMTEYGFSKEQIEEMENYIKELNYSLPLHQNYQLTREFLQQYGIAKKYIATIQSLVKNMDAYYHLDETLTYLDKGLENRLPISMELYRAIKSSFLKKALNDGEDLTSLVGKKIKEDGYSSTSPLYDTSFAKYDDYDVVFDIYAPKGTEGIQVTPFSSYGTAEQEVLLNSNDLFILDVRPNVVDKNGRTKTICKALMLSKDKSCYHGIGNKQEKNKEEFSSYREKINNILKSSTDEYVYSAFSVYKTEKEQDRCHHILEIVTKVKEKKILLEQDFEYNEDFKKEMLESSIVDFARRNPIDSTKLMPSRKENYGEITNDSKSDIYLFSETNNMLIVNNIDTSLAVQIVKQARQINPDIFDNELKQMDNANVSLTKGGFINVLVLSSVVVSVCVVVFLVTLYLIS